MWPGSLAPPVRIRLYFPQSIRPFSGTVLAQSAPDLSAFQWLADTQGASRGAVGSRRWDGTKGEAPRNCGWSFSWEIEGSEVSKSGALSKV